MKVETFSARQQFIIAESGHFEYRCVPNFKNTLLALVVAAVEVIIQGELHK